MLSLFERLVIADYETTSTALSYLFYVLATHSEEQVKLQQHIDVHLSPDSRDEMPPYDVISEMETLRMYLIAPIVITRQSTEEFHIQGFGTIPAGTRIAPDMYKLHYDLDIWGPIDPHEFHPERFATKLRRNAICTDGVEGGPRLSPEKVFSRRLWRKNAPSLRKSQRIYRRCTRSCLCSTATSRRTLDLTEYGDQRVERIINCFIALD